MLLASLLAPGCVSTHSGARDAADPRAALLAAADAAFARRADAAELDRAMALWQKALALGEDAGVQTRLARALNFAAGEAQGEERRALLRRSVEHAARASALAGHPSDPCAARASAADVGAVFWRAQGLAELAHAAGVVGGADDRRAALCLARRAVELEAGYFHAGPLRLRGRLLARMPALEGGDLAQSRRDLDKAIELAPGFLANRLELAASWAVKAQDRAVFDAALEQVLSAPEKRDDEAGPENARARREARALREEAGELF